MLGIQLGIQLGSTGNLASAIATITDLVVSDEAGGEIDIDMTITTTAAVDFVISTSATTPTATQVRAGQDHTGTAVTAFTATVSSSGGVVTETIGDDTTGTYYMHAVAEGSDTVATSNSFTRTAAVVGEVTAGIEKITIVSAGSYTAPNWTATAGVEKITISEAV